MGSASQVQFYFGGVAMKPFLLAHQKKILKSLETPNIKSFYWKIECLPFSLATQVKRAQLLAKHNGMKLWWYWEHVGEHSKNLGKHLRT
jgi:hypothetical protein